MSDGSLSRRFVHTVTDAQQEIDRLRAGRWSAATDTEVPMATVIVFTLVTGATLILGAHIWAVVAEQVLRGK